MNATPRSPSTIASLRALLERQKAAQLRAGPPSAEVRIDRLERCIRLLREHGAALAEALDQDFGCRSKDYSLRGDIGGSIAPLQHACSHVREWMQTRTLRTSPAKLEQAGARAELRYQPKGVVGIMAPWNFPIFLLFSPLAGVLAAGNRAMLKPSELTPRTSELLARLVAEAFAPEEIAVVTGGADTAREFSRLPFDHLVFTGGTAVGREVMRAAAENLVPVTLELGGKNPVIVGRSSDFPQAARRIMAGKCMNAGQVCLAPDYLLVPQERRDEFVGLLQAAAARLFPSLRDNPKWTAIIDARHFERLQVYVADAVAKGAQVIRINPASEDFSAQPHRKLPPTLLLDVREDMRVMQEEIFGPLLPVLTYRSIGDAIAEVNRRERPLAAYYFGDDEAETEIVLNRVIAGGTTINDVGYHLLQEELPFGGIGASGMGAYHGVHGFVEFSHRRAVYVQPRDDAALMQVLGRPAPRN